MSADEKVDPIDAAFWGPERTRNIEASKKPSIGIFQCEYEDRMGGQFSKQEIIDSLQARLGYR